jgi:hypothetical protein
LSNLVIRPLLSPTESPSGRGHGAGQVAGPVANSVGTAQDMTRAPWLSPSWNVSATLIEDWVCVLSWLFISV